MKRTAFGALVIVVLAAALGVTLVIATPWTDTETASGNVTASGDPGLLYICEAGLAFACADDDSDADEIFLDGDEGLEAGAAPLVAPLLLFTLSSGDWDLTAAEPTITETADPGSDCSEGPVVSFVRVDGDGDDHAPADAPIAGSQSFPDGADVEGVVHVVGSFGVERMEVHVRLPADTDAECIGSAWDIDIDFVVQPHE